MAIYHPPTPAVFVGGAQPYGPRKWIREEQAQLVNDPPFRYGGPYVAIFEVAIISQPDPWVYAFMGRAQPFEARKLPVDISAVPENDPPFADGRATRIQSELVNIAQPDPWQYVFFGALQPFEPKKLSPGTPGQSIDRPNPIHRGRTIVVQSEIAVIAQPNPWIYAISFRQPYDAKRLPPSIVAVPENNPPFGMRGRVTLNEIMSIAWTPPPPLPYRPFGSGSIFFRGTTARGYILG